MTRRRVHYSDGGSGKGRKENSSHEGGCEKKDS